MLAWCCIARPGAQTRLYWWDGILARPLKCSQYKSVKRLTHEYEAYGHICASALVARTTAMFVA
jgi:hypothetical protein